MPLAYGLIEPIDVSLSHLPPALDGLRIAHLTDLHVRRETARHRRLLNQLTAVRLDLAVWTGDYMSHPGDEPAAETIVRRFAQRLRPTLGSFGVFGNHDTAELRDRLRDAPIHWLDNQHHRLDTAPIELLGLGLLDSESPDSVALALDLASGRPGGAEQEPAGPAGDRPLRLMLSHWPSMIFTAADMGVDLMLSGHTHGGQCRLPSGRALVNSCDLPLHLTSGLLRHRDTLAAVSRGLGEMAIPLRLFCPPHLPVYTLRRRAVSGRRTDRVECVRRW